MLAFHKLKIHRLVNNILSDTQRYECLKSGKVLSKLRLDLPKCCDNPFVMFFVLIRGDKLAQVLSRM